jgi:hypothetical protein
MCRGLVSSQIDKQAEQLPSEQKTNDQDRRLLATGLIDIALNLFHEALPTSTAGSSSHAERMVKAGPPKTNQNELLPWARRISQDLLPPAADQASLDFTPYPR